MTLLAVCIPTYNRAGSMMSLVESLLAMPGDFEICVHDDGSSDGTHARLVALEDSRLRVSRAENAGRAQALLAAVSMAQSRYVMFFDDDDLLYRDGLHAVLRDCATTLPSGCAGFIYHLEDQAGQRIGSEFGVKRSNFVALRADYAVSGDKKEVVLRSVLLPAMRISGHPRRVPTSLYWARIAMIHDVVCRNRVIGRKTYLEGGMSDSIRTLKAANPWPMYLLARARLDAFTAKRYGSLRFAVHSLAGVFVYGARSFLQAMPPGPA